MWHGLCHTLAVDEQVRVSDTFEAECKMDCIEYTYESTSFSTFVTRQVSVMEALSCCDLLLDAAQQPKSSPISQPWQVGCYLGNPDQALVTT